MRVSDIMTTPAFAVREEDTLDHARNLMIRHRIDGLPVVEGEATSIGWLDALAVVSTFEGAADDKRRVPRTRTVADVMGPNPGSVAPSMTLTRAAQMLASSPHAGVPVIDGGRVVGVLSAVDVLFPLADRTAGSLLVDDIARIDAPTAHRHASLPSLLRQMEQNDARLVAITEGQGFVPDSDPTGRRGIVGVVTPATLVSAAWFERDSPNVHVGKRIKMTRKDAPAGLAWKRSIRDAEYVAEDLMDPNVPVTRPDAGIASAARLLASARTPGALVLDGPRLRYLDRRELLRRMSGLLQTA